MGREILTKDRSSYILNSGTAFDWPKFTISPVDLLNERVNIVNFIGHKFQVDDFRSIKEYLKRASGKNEKAPYEATQYFEIMFFENTSNRLFYDFRKSLGNELIDSQLEINTDHGYSHQRRLEKILKEFLKNDRSYRSNPNLLFNTLSQFLTIRFHDILELLPTGKKNHTEGGALLALGFLLKNKALFDAIVKENGSNPTDDHVYKKILISTFIHCLYHTQPKMLDLVKSQIENNKTISLHDLILPELFEKLNISESFFKEKFGTENNLYQLINTGLQFINSKSASKKDMNLSEISAMIASSKVFAAIDKLDSILPPELSTAKTFITMKKEPRPFFAPIESIIYRDDGRVKDEISQNLQEIHKKIIQGLPLDINEEYQVRILLADSTFSPDDFSRLLFEMRRLDSMDLPPWLMAGFKYALEIKSHFLIKAIPKLLEQKDNYGIFLDTYLKAEADLLTELLIKHQVSNQIIGELRQDYIRLVTSEERDKFISKEVFKIFPKLNLSGLFKGLSLLRQELIDIEEILSIKTGQLEKNNQLNKTTADRARQLLQLADADKPIIDVDERIFSTAYMAYLAIT
ncbi:MAG: hypothetical protein WC744_02600 [Patescibacteria group bacterium]|jgi:hypothetical protein